MGTQKNKHHDSAIITYFPLLFPGETPKPHGNFQQKDTDYSDHLVKT